MSEGREPPDEGLSEEELEGHDVEELPDREAMSVIRGDVTIPLDPDIAADVLLDQDDGEDSDEETRGLTPERAGEPALDRPRGAAARHDRPLAAPAGLVQDREQQVLDVEPRVAALDRLAHRLLEHLARARRDGRAARPARAARRPPPAIAPRRTASQVMPHSSSASRTGPRSSSSSPSSRWSVSTRSAPSRAASAFARATAWRARPATTRPSCARWVRRAWRACAACLVTPSDSATCRHDQPASIAWSTCAASSVSSRRRSSRTAVRPAAGSPSRDAARASCCSLGRRLMRAAS